MLGADGVPWDRFSRQARLDDTARRCFDSLDADTQRWCASYVDGINQALDAGVRGGPEFDESGTAPARWNPWTPLGVFLVQHILFSTFPNKLFRAHVGPDPRPRRRRPVQHRGPRVLRQQRLGRPRLGHRGRRAADRRRPAPPPGAARRLPAGAPCLPGVRRRRLRLPRRPGPAALRPHRPHRLGHHQRHGRLPGPLRRRAAPERGRRHPGARPPWLGTRRRGRRDDPGPGRRVRGRGGRSRPPAVRSSPAGPTAAR